MRNLSNRAQHLPSALFRSRKRWGGIASLPYEIFFVFQRQGHLQAALESFAWTCVSDSFFCLFLRCHSCMPSFKPSRLGMSALLVPNGKKIKIKDSFNSITFWKLSASELSRCVGFMFSTLLCLAKWRWDYFKNTLFLELWLYNMFQTLFMVGVIYLNALLGKETINLLRC